MKLTARQIEVLANLSRITTDGCRHEPQYRLEERAVSHAVRALIQNGLVELRDGKLIQVAATPIKAPAAAFDTEAVVNAMRELLGDAKS